MLQVISFRRLPARCVFARIADRGADRASAPIVRFTRALLRRSVAAWRRHRDEQLLQALNDHQLRDIGISRADIGHLARHGRMR